MLGLNPFPASRREYGRFRVQVGVQSLLNNERQRIPQDISGAGVYDERRAESVKIMEDVSKPASRTLVIGFHSVSWRCQGLLESDDFIFSK